MRARFEAANSDELDLPADPPIPSERSEGVPLVRRRIGRPPEDLRPACVQMLREIVCAEASPPPTPARMPLGLLAPDDSELG
jgi:hypothetical protein